MILEHVEEWQFHTGERILHPFVTVMEVRDGKIVRWHDYSNIGNVIDHAPQWWLERIAQGYAAVGHVASRGMALEVVDNPDRSRYELRDDGHLVGFTEYHERDGVLVFPHTVITEPKRGAGYGAHARAGCARRRPGAGPAIVAAVPVRGRFVGRAPRVRRPARLTVGPRAYHEGHGGRERARGPGPGRTLGGMVPAPALLTPARETELVRADGRPQPGVP